MTNLILTSSFKRAFKAIIKREPNLKQKIEAKLRLLADNPYNPILRTHKLKGKLSGAWACSVEYDCRIIFNFEQNQDTLEEEIILIDIGTHDEVY
ncbi:type II toxin-antitoxin system mRNA interferase toxin, RelE/StbE family [Moorena producens JHB]|uniref:Type II toxin-antitoxin system mRNA interferase toxin, RelE/StbE family n=1 Tax=Moorena producens (strain JHB) TaxID=1454205 RepID=A0A9Q9STB4_MOOP1|nr:type II toxin-antitoxin system mRNA interferase toxin, RelE/StbE family [Moorena producens]WAN69266.1 type II toxin-antitoxin system mRNA interferase toxin, RelE/StbE family [Moorena producens JHB]